MNEYLPVLRASLEERLLRYWETVHEQVEAKREKQEKIPVPGTPAWSKNIIAPVLGGENMSRFEAAFMLNSRAGWEFLEAFVAYPYFRDGRGLTVKVMKRVLKPFAKVQGEPGTFSDVSVNRSDTYGNECTDWSTHCTHSCGRR